MRQAAGLAGSLVHLAEHLTRGTTTAICYIFCLYRIFTPTHSATDWMKCALVLCVGKKNENNGHSGKIKLFSAFQKEVLFSLLSLCSHNGLILVLHWNTPKARKTSHPEQKQMCVLKVIDKRGMDLGGLLDPISWGCVRKRLPAQSKGAWMAGRGSLGS